MAKLKSDIQGVVFAIGARQHMWYVELMAKTTPRRKCPWGTTQEIRLLT